MKAEERAMELYPDLTMTEEDKEYLKKCGYTDRDIAISKSERMFTSAVNEKLREAYLLGRKEKEEYE